MKLSDISSVVAAAMLLSLPQARAADAACNSWKQVTSPNIGVGDNVLSSVAANSATDIWAVGLLAPDSNPNITNTLTQHYDGTSWSVVASPNIGTKANGLLSVTASSGLAWAAGYYIDPSHQTRSLIEAWNGTAWATVPHTTPGTMDLLFNISAVSTTDIWAVGVQRNGDGPFQTLIEHFDGAFWTSVPSPNPGSTGNWLFGVHAIAANSAWAVGQMFGDGPPDQALIEHWDGTSWSVVPGAPDAGYAVLLYAVAGTSDANLWTAGDAQNNVQSPMNLVEQYTSGAWRMAHSFNVGPGENHYYGIAALPGNTVWAVGGYAPTVNGNLNTLIERRDNLGWMQEVTPSPGQANGNSLLGGIAIVSPSDVWAVGAYDGVNASRSLILHRCQ